MNTNNKSIFGENILVQRSNILSANQVFVHGDELDNYYKEFDADILPSEFNGKNSKYDGKAIAAKLFD